MEKNVFDLTVETLINDAKSLQSKFTTLQEKNDFRGAIDCMRLLKDTLSLIKEYDWQLKFLEQETPNGKQVFVWEQNHSGDIKNHKLYEVATIADAPVVNNIKRDMYIDCETININPYELAAIIYFDGKKKKLRLNSRSTGQNDFLNFNSNKLKVF